MLAVLLQISFQANQFNIGLDHFKGGQRTQLKRLVCDLDTGSVKAFPLAQRTAEFPNMNWDYNGRPYE